jgi:pimeloyl-ACP methyl ester carboxylesterase
MTVQSVSTAVAVDRFYDVRNVRLHTIQWGDRAATTVVLMLHGVGGNAQSFNTLGPRMAAAGMRAIALDQRGSGSSSSPETGYGIDECAADIEAICAVEGLSSIVVVGHSRGGWQAAYLAGRRPDLVSKIVLIDPARIGFASENDADDFYRGVRALFGPFANIDEAIAAGRERDPAVRWTPEREASFLAGLTTRADGSLVARTSLDVLAQLRAARGEGDRVRETVATVMTPTLMFVSSKAAPARQAQKLEYAELIPGVRVEFVDATHAIHQDEPDLVASTVLDFLAAT